MNRLRSPLGDEAIDGTFGGGESLSHDRISAGVSCGAVGGTKLELWIVRRALEVMTLYNLSRDGSVQKGCS
jgi:hypothetical protein